MQERVKVNGNKIYESICKSEFKNVYQKELRKFVI